MHYHLTIPVLLVGSFVLILGIVFACAAFLDKRRENAAPFRNYFGSEYDRALLRNGSFSDADYVFSDPQTSIEDFDVRHSGPTNWPKVSNTTRPERK